MIRDGLKLIDSGNMSGDIESEEFGLSEADYGCLDLEWTGTAPVGVITIETRTGDNSPLFEVDFGSVISITGNTGSHRLQFLQLPWTKLKITYTRTSGTGTLNAYIVTKQDGGR